MGNESNNNLVLVDWLHNKKDYKDISAQLEQRETTNWHREKCLVHETDRKVVFITESFTEKNGVILITVGTNEQPIFYPFKKLYKKYRKKNYRIFFLSVGNTGNKAPIELMRNFVLAIEPLNIPNHDLVQLYRDTTEFKFFKVKTADELKEPSYLHQPTSNENFYVSILRISEDNTDKTVKIDDDKCLEEYLDTFDSRVYTDMVDVTKWIATEMHENNAKDLGLPRNLLIYGAPGTGKSHYIDDKFEKDFYCVNIPEEPEKLEQYRKTLSEELSIDIPENADIEAMIKDEFFTRVTFYEDYSYENFVGCYKPVEDEDGKITYKFEAGPFIDIYIKAKKDSNHNYLLAIEEINRANAAAVFGDLFQVLDRDNDGSSEYSVKPEAALNKYLAEHLKDYDYDGTISLPSNLYIWATMNSADQGVHVLDSAFKRRWQFQYMDINNSESAPVDDKRKIVLPVKNNDGNIEVKTYTWDSFRTAVNKVLEDNKIEEDRWVGAWFFKQGELDLIKKFYTNKDNTKLKPNPLVDKLLAYLLQDVVKMNKDILFEEKYHNMSSIRKDLSNSTSPKNIFDVLKIDKSTLKEIQETEPPTPTDTAVTENG